MSPIAITALSGWWVMATSLPAQQIADRPSPSYALRGTVYDSIAGAPLSDATVQLVPDAERSAMFAVRTDSTGAFVARGLRPGRYLAAFSHARLDSLRVSLAPRSLSLPTDSVVALAIPSSATIVAAHCGIRSEDVGVIVGRVARPRATTARDGRPPATTVRATWTELTIGRRDVTSAAQRVETVADEDGAFALCGAPVDTPLEVVSWSGPDTTTALDATISATRVLVQHITIDFAARRIVSGTVLRPGGIPIAGARVALRGDTARATTDAGGRFRLAGVTGGTRTLEVRAIGFEPRRVTVDIATEGDSSSVAAVILQPLTTTLETVRVTASASLASFYRRRERFKMGTFLDPEALAKRDPMFVADAVRSLPGIRIKRSGSFSDKLVFKSGTKECEPWVYIDGRLIPMTTTDLDGYLAADDIGAIEIYVRPEDVPIELLSPAVPPCGAVVFWRGARPPRPK